EANRMYVGPTRKARIHDVEQVEPAHQNRKYRCAIGSTAAGSLVRCSPSAYTAYVAGSTSTRGKAALWTMSRLPSCRVLRTASTRVRNRSRRGTSASSAACETNVIVVLRGVAAANMGRYSTGSGVGIEAFGSPIAAYAISPPLSTSSGFTPKNAGCQSTRSASLPASIDPTRWPMPWAIAGLIVYLAT